MQGETLQRSDHGQRAISSLLQENRQLLQVAKLPNARKLRLCVLWRAGPHFGIRNEVPQA